MSQTAACFCTFTFAGNSREGSRCIWRSSTPQTLSQVLYTERLVQVATAGVITSMEPCENSKWTGFSSEQSVKHTAPLWTCWRHFSLNGFESTLMNQPQLSAVGTHDDRRDLHIVFWVDKYKSFYRCIISRNIRELAE